MKIWGCNSWIPEAKLHKNIELGCICNRGGLDCDLILVLPKSLEMGGGRILSFLSGSSRVWIPEWWGPHPVPNTQNTIWYALNLAGAKCLVICSWPLAQCMLATLLVQRVASWGWCFGVGVGPQRKRCRRQIVSLVNLRMYANFISPLSKISVRSPANKPWAH